MFTKEENLFLEAISKMFSTNNEERKISEQNIQTWLQQTYLQVLLACNKFIICEKLPDNIREYSCFLLKLCAGIKYYQDWQKINPELKTSVQANSLGLLGDKSPNIRNQACNLVTAIFEISVRDQGWPNLIKTLCDAAVTNNIDFQTSAIKTLGMIWEKLPKEPFSFDELNLMENTIIGLLSQPKNEQLAMCCLDAYQYFIDYIKNKFTEQLYLENSLKMLITYCNSMNNINTINVTKNAIHRITQIIILAYDYVESHFRHISEFFIQLAQGQNEFLAIQALLFFVEVSSDEIYRKDNGFTYRKYIPSIWNILWPCIQFVLNIGKKNDNDEFCRYDAINYLLANLSVLCDESIIDDVFKYMGEKLNDNDPLKIASAIYAFGCLVETVHVEKIASVIPDSIDSMSKLFDKNNQQLSTNLAWCFSRICISHPKIILDKNNLFTFLINTIINLLKQQSLINQVKMHLCESIYNLASYIFNNGLQKWNLFSPFLQDLLLTLEVLAYLPSSYDTDNNLAKQSFLALFSLIECSHEKDRVLISFFMDKILMRLTEAQDITKFNGNKEKQYFYQSMLCLVVQSLCKNSVHNLIQLDNNKIEQYFNIIENFFKIRESVFEEGLLASACLITLISNNQIDNLLKRIMVYIKYALNNYIDADNCSAACLCLSDLITSSKEKFEPYINEIYPLFNNIIKAENAKKHILTLIIVVYSDLFNYVGEKIWIYYKEPMDFMIEIMNFSQKNHEIYLNNKIEQEELDYFLKLNEGVVDFIQSVAEQLRKSDETKIEAFKSYMPDIIDYLETMIADQMFNPNGFYLDSCLSFLICFTEIYKQYLFKRVSEYTWQRIFQLANSSDDDNIIHLKDYLQNLLYTVKIQA